MPITCNMLFPVILPGNSVSVIEGLVDLSFFVYVCWVPHYNYYSPIRNRCDNDRENDAQTDTEVCFV